MTEADNSRNLAWLEENEMTASKHWDKKKKSVTLKFYNH